MVFCMVSPLDVKSWTQMMAVYVEPGQDERALQFYRHMHLSDVPSNSYMLVTTLQACSILLDKGEASFAGAIKEIAMEISVALHKDAQREGLISDVFVATPILTMYGKLGRLAEAKGIFVKLSQYSIVSWAALIAGSAERGSCGEALVCFEQMQQEDVSPDVVLWDAIVLAHAERAADHEKAFKFYAELHEQGVSPDSNFFVSVLKACRDPATLEVRRRVHAIFCRGGPEAREVILMNALIDMYGRCGIMVDAQKVFDVMPMWDLSSWNLLSSHYARQRGSELVFRLFHKMRQNGIPPDGVSFLNFLTGCSHAGLVHESCDYFEAMIQQSGITPTIKQETYLIDLFVRAGQLDEAMLLYRQMQEEGMRPNHQAFAISFASHNLSCFLASVLAYAYGSCASVGDMQTSFDGLSEPDLITWSACMTGFSGKGSCVASLKLLEVMQLSDVKPNEITFSSVLSACSHDECMVGFPCFDGYDLSFRELYIGHDRCFTCISTRDELCCCGPGGPIFSVLFWDVGVCCCHVLRVASFPFDPGGLVIDSKRLLEMPFDPEGLI